MNTITQGTYAYQRARWNSKQHPRLYASHYYVWGKKSNTLGITANSRNGRPIVVRVDVALGRLRVLGKSCAFCCASLDQKDITFLATAKSATRVLICEECIEVSKQLLRERRRQEWELSALTDRTGPPQEREAKLKDLE